MKRRPHRMTLKDGTVLSFWTATPMMIAKNGLDYERDGKPAEALSMWKASHQSKGGAADDATRQYCAARIAALEHTLKGATA